MQSSTMTFKIYHVMVTLMIWRIGDVGAATCPEGQISCRTGDQCVSYEEVCTDGQQCFDGSDENPEICALWKTDDCGKGMFSCTLSTSLSTYYKYRKQCKSLEVICSETSCQETENIKGMCKIVEGGKLQLGPDEPGLELTADLMSFLKDAVSKNTTALGYSCPMLYTQVGNACVSIFSLAKVPWSEARQFCLSIKGDLLSTEAVDFEDLLQYIRKSQLTSDYWVGGRFDLDTNAWSWVIDDKPMPLGSPYWATKYNSSCVRRPPPQTNPFHDPPEAVNGAPCYHYVQTPTKRIQGFCAAMTYEHFHQFSDEVCQENRSPLCVYVQKPN